MKDKNGLNFIFLNIIIIDMNNIRTNIYKKYKSFKDFKEEKGKLLKQQVFLSKYINDNYDNIDRMLLFHGIGTGKTCTSITIAEMIMTKNPKMKTLVILPARLKTNFIDELLSESCGLNKYITKDLYEKYNNDKITKKEKELIKKNFLLKIEENYQIVSYESFRKKLLDSKNIKKTIDDLTRDKVIIIDEVHNLITSKINPDKLRTIIENNQIPKKTTTINGVIMRLLTKLAHKSSKLFLLTATPIFDNYGQFIEMLLNLRPDIDDKTIKRDAKNIKTYINLLKGKISFYKIKDRSAFPSTEIDNIEIEMSKTQDKIISVLEDENENKELSTMFCISERQLSISVYDKSKANKIFSNLKEYAPKLKKLFDLLKLSGKHLIYSNFIQYCLELIGLYLEKNGWSNYIKTGIVKNKTFVLWDASLNDDNKIKVKNVLNSKDNMDGSLIKVILGSPSIKEGVSFKHVQHLHQIDPVWNSSAKEQVEGRCIRYKSHEDIPANNSKLKRKVIIHNYILVPRKKNPLTLQTCDQNIYYNIMVTKKKIITIIEKLLAKVSIDYYLWTKDMIPKSKSKSSIISVSKEKLSLDKYVKEKRVKVNSSCPKKRRPENNKCLIEGYIIKKNKHGEDCCYKQPKTKKNI